MKSVLEAAKTGDWKQVSPQTIEAAKFWLDGNTGDNILASSPPGTENTMASLSHFAAQCFPCSTTEKA